YAHRAMGVEVWQEEPYADLIRLYIAAGRPAEALAQYQALEQRLQQALGETPSPSLRALVEPLRQQSHATAIPRMGRPVPPLPSQPTGSQDSISSANPTQTYPRLPMPLTRFFGREAECAALEDLLTSTADGTSPPAHRLITLTGTGG